jgi:hypothetical protein
MSALRLARRATPFQSGGGQRLQHKLSWRTPHVRFRYYQAVAGSPRTGGLLISLRSADAISR